MSKSKCQIKLKCQNPNNKAQNCFSLSFGFWTLFDIWALDFICHLGFGFLIISCYLLSAGTASADWPMFMKDTVHSSYSSDTLSLPLKLKWRFKTDGPIYSSPAVSDGVIYFGSKDGWIYAVSIKEGKLLWKYETRGKVLTSPLVAEDVVFIGANDYYFYALSAKDGRSEER